MTIFANPVFNRHWSAALLWGVLSFSLLFGVMYLNPAHAESDDSIYSLKERTQNLASERAYLRRKKEETLHQAKSITGQIITNQRKLDQAHWQLRNQQVALVKTREQLNAMAGDIHRTSSQQTVLQREGMDKMTFDATCGGIYENAYVVGASCRAPNRPRNSSSSSSAWPSPNLATRPA